MWASFLHPHTYDPHESRSSKEFNENINFNQIIQYSFKVHYYYSLSDSSLADSFFHFFCNKTFKFTIQTWQTSLEHYHVCI